MLSSREVVVGSGPALVGGERNEFLDVHVEMLHDAGIAARLAVFADIGAENQAGWASQRELDRYFVLVPDSQAERARQVNEKVSDCRICLKCKAYIKPALTRCPRCGVADERDPAVLHAEYRAMMLNQARDRLSAEGYEEIYESLKGTLLAHDPLHVGCGSNAQYDYGTTVVFTIPRLENCFTLAQVRQVAEEQLGSHFPSADISAVELGVLTSDWWRLWSEFRKRRDGHC